MKTAKHSKEKPFEPQSSDVFLPKRQAEPHFHAKESQVLVSFNLARRQSNKRTYNTPTVALNLLARPDNELSEWKSKRARVLRHIKLSWKNTENIFCQGIKVFFSKQWEESSHKTLKNAQDGILEGICEEIICHQAEALYVSPSHNKTLDFDKGAWSAWTLYAIG